MALFINSLPATPPVPFFTLPRRMVPKTRALVLAAAHGCSTYYAVRCSTDATATKLSNQQPHRRSAEYLPPNWDYELLESLKNEYAGRTYAQRSSVLKEQVKTMLEEEMKPLCQLELIDDLQRLGISYHFEDQIKSILRKIYIDNSGKIRTNVKGLYETALEFRLLRQHHFHVSQDVFDCFRCESGNFKASLCMDTRGLLYLYEASFLLTENESTLELAREFTIKHLKKNLGEERVDPELAALVRHALELPLHWRMLRSEARWFVDVYEKRPDTHPAILELAKLDFNMVQATYQMDLQYLSRWWKSTGFSERFRFARDRLVESFFWTVGEIFNPEYGYCRRMATKVNALLTTIDDIYDVYGTLDELELFTDAVERWDTKSIDQLPEYMRICYLALFNSVNEMGYDALKEQGAYIIPHLTKSWADICRSYLQEAKWYFSGYTPTLGEYLNNAWISAGVPVMLVHAYFLASNRIKKENLECLEKYQNNIIRYSSMILRLTDDLQTSSDEMKRGDVSKSIQCYMKENNASEEEAREHIKKLIGEMWKEMNKERIRETPFSQTFMEIAMNIGRTAQCMYENGDGHGHQDSVTRNRISALLFEPIHLA